MSHPFLAGSKCRCRFSAWSHISLSLQAWFLLAFIQCKSTQVSDIYKLNQRIQFPKGTMLLSFLVPLVSRSNFSGHSIRLPLIRDSNVAFWGSCRLSLWKASLMAFKLLRPGRLISSIISSAGIHPNLTSGRLGEDYATFLLHIICSFAVWEMRHKLMSCASWFILFLAILEIYSSLSASASNILINWWPV